VAGFFLGRDGRWHASPARLAHHAGSVLASVPDEALPGLVARLADELDVSVAVYANDGRLLTAAGPKPPLAAAESSRTSIHPGRFRRFGGDAPAGSGRSLRLVLNVGEGDWLLRIFGTLALVIAVVALVSAPLARAIARPIERLADAARRLGQGDLKVRSGLAGGGEIGSLGRTFDDMAERLEGLLGAQRHLLADVSHELRTPLARLRVSLALAAEASPG
jgi:signal transduction histidine kinase